MSTVSLTVTPGAVVTAESTVDPALLNRLATPKVELLPGAGLGPEHLRLSEISDQLSPSVRGYSWLPAGALWPLQFESPGGLSCPAGAFTYNAKDIWVSPAGAAAVSSRTADGPVNGIPWSLTVVGATGVTTCEIGTYANADLTGPLVGKNLIVSAYIYNGTGGPFTPQLIVRTSDALNDEDAVTVRVGPLNAVDGPIPNAAWTRAYWRLTAGDLVNLANGVEIVIRVPSGSMAANTKLVRVAQWQGEIGDATPTTYIVIPPPPKVNDLAHVGDLKCRPLPVPIEGWLLCDGSAVSRTVYAALFGYLGTAFGVGDGATTFNLPDMRGRVALGLDNFGTAAAAASRLAQTVSITTTAGSINVTVAATSGLTVGMIVQAMGVPDGVTIAGIQSSTQFTLSAVATTTETRNARVYFYADPATPATAGGIFAHKLTVEQMPKHRHLTSGIWSFDGTENSIGEALAGGSSHQDYYSDYQGGDQPHPNLPPYLAVAWFIRY